MMDLSAVTMISDRPPGPPMDRSYQPTIRDVCSGRGKKHWNLPGNIAFRNHIQTRVHEYLARTTKIGKTTMVASIVHELRQMGFSFLKQTKEGLWYDIGDKEARDKVGHSLRDQVTAIRKAQSEGEGGPTTSPGGDNNSTSTNQTGLLNSIMPQQLLQQQQQQLQRRRPSIALSDSGQESDLRRSELESTRMYASFARRPSWIAGEQLSSNEDSLNSYGWKYVDQFMEMDISSMVAADDDESATGPTIPTTTLAPTAAVEIPTAAAATISQDVPSNNMLCNLVYTAEPPGRAAAVAAPHLSSSTAMVMDDSTHLLMKASLLTFDARMSTMSNAQRFMPTRRRSSCNYSGRTSLRNFTQQFFFCDVSMASESFSASDDFDP